MDEIMKNLYDKKLKYRCYFDIIKSQQFGDLCLVYMADSFIITSNFWGCCAVGDREFNYNNNKVVIKYKILKDEISNGIILKLLNKHEKELNHKKQIIYIKEV